MNKLSLNKSSIARQFIVYTVLFSSLITILITVFQLYRDYKADLNIIHTELNQVESVHLDSLNSALWASNSQLLQTSLEGILQIRDVQFVEIRDEEKIWATAGKIKGTKNIQQIYPMKFHQRGKDINIGTLTVNVNLNGVYQRLYEKVWVILISNGIKTFLVAIFIYFLFYRLVARHLTTISDFSKEHDPLSNNSSLLLERNNKSHDELDVVVSSINDMHSRLYEQISEINQQKQHLLQTLNSIGDAVITTDNEGCITRLNPVAEQLTGWTNENANNQSLKTVFKIIDSSTRKPIANPVEKVLKTGETIYLSNHTTLISKNGDEYQIADSAAAIRDDENILGMVLVFNDVTEQYQLREELKSKERVQREILQSMVDAIITIDDEGEINTFNHSAELLFGYSFNEIVGKNISCLIPNPDVQQHNQYIKNYIQTGESKVIGVGREVIGLRKDQTTFPMNLSINELSPSPNGRRRFIGSCSDLTQTKENEEQLQRSQKMDALGKLTGGIAHDYNNMLGVVLGYAELLQGALQNKPELISYVNEIMHAGERGAKLTKQLLSFSRHKRTDANALELNSVLNASRHMLEKTLTARIQLDYQLDSELWLSCIDESEFEDAILNIVINAMHAIEGNGCLTIKTKNIKIDTVHAASLGVVEGYFVRLSISDTGYGMDSFTKEKIFDPFFSTKGELGNGLGLSQVYGFVSRSGGAIKVDSVLGQGSTFNLYFPRDYKGEESLDVDEVSATDEVNGEESILVVDDELALLKLTCNILSSHGYTVFRAESAAQALEVLAVEKIGILFTDIIMPEMDGYELAEIVKEKYPHVKIQLASGFTGKHFTNQADNALTITLLQKPYNAQILLKMIRSL